MAYVVQPMVLDDVEEVSRVETECFTTPWPINAYRRELRENRLSKYLVLRWSSSDGRRVETNVGSAAAGDPLAGMRRAVSQLLRPFGVGDQPRSTLPSILGFAGLWLMFDEAHITTIGVRRTVRGLGLGELLLVNLVESARELGANRLTLEVRVSNHVAQSLYRKYTFKEEGVRKRYYSDNGEDALIMWSDRIDAPAFVDTFRVLRTELDRKIAALSAPIVESRV